MQQREPTDAEIEQVREMSDKIVASMQTKKGLDAPLDICLSALGEVMIDICHFIGLNKLGFVDTCRQLIDQYEDCPNAQENA